MNVTDYLAQISEHGYDSEFVIDVLGTQLELFAESGSQGERLLRSLDPVESGNLEGENVLTAALKSGLIGIRYACLIDTSLD